MPAPFSEDLVDSYSCDLRLPYKLSTECGNPVRVLRPGRVVHFANVANSFTGYEYPDAHITFPAIRNV